MAGHRDAPGSREEPEPVRQASGDLVHGECPHPRSGKLDCKRHAVQLPTDLDHCLGVLIRYSERRQGRHRALGEEANRLELADLIGQGQGIRLRKRQ